MSFIQRNIALPPSTNLYPSFSSQRHLPFDITINEALKCGEINNVLETDERLTLASVKNVGDSHFYAIIGEIKYSDAKTQAAISYLAKDMKNFGVWRDVELEFNGRLNLPSKELIRGEPGRRYIVDNFFSKPQAYLEIDKWVMNTLCRSSDLECRDQSFGLKGLFTNSTKRIVLRGNKSKKPYVLYYKFAPSTSMELFARKFIGLAGLNSSIAFRSKIDEYAIWTKEVLGRQLLGLLKFFLDAEDMKNTFYGLGNILPFLCLGEEKDQHFENILVPDGGSPSFIDLETFFGEVTCGNMSNVNALINRGIEMFFNWNPNKIQVPEECYEQIFIGMKDTIQHVLMNPFFCGRFKDIIDDFAGQSMLSRLVIEGTGVYFPQIFVPHYSVPIAMHTIDLAVRERLHTLFEAISNGIRFDFPARRLVLKSYGKRMAVEKYNLMYGPWDGSINLTLLNGDLKDCRQRLFSE